MKKRTGILMLTGVIVAVIAGAVTWASGVYAVDGNPDSDCPERLFGLYCPTDPSPVDNPNIDCPGREFGLYCPDDPSPVDDPNLDCPERAFGLYCLDDPSPEENPNLASPTPTSTPTPIPTQSSNDGDGGDDGDSGASEEPQPTPTPNPTAGRVLGVSTTDSNATDFISNHLVPLTVERIFGEVFGRKITHAESVYWKIRARSDKATESKLKDTMFWHRANGSTGVKQKTENTISSLVPKINAIFRSVHTRNPLPAENRYWLSRIADKVTEIALHGAMVFHKQHGIIH